MTHDGRFTMDNARGMAKLTTGELIIILRTNSRFKSKYHSNIWYIVLIEYPPVITLILIKSLIVIKSPCSFVQPEFGFAGCVNGILANR